MKAKPKTKGKNKKENEEEERETVDTDTSDEEEEEGEEREEVCQRCIYVKTSVKSFYVMIIISQLYVVNAKHLFNFCLYFYFFIILNGSIIFAIFFTSLFPLFSTPYSLSRTM